MHAAGRAMSEQRWADAAEALGGRPGSEPALLGRLCRNLAALQTHRPDVYEPVVRELAAGRPATRYATYAVDAQTFGLALRQPDGRLVALCNGRNPLDAARQVADQTRAGDDPGQAVGLMGLGEGHVLIRLAADPPKLFMTQRQAVFIFEPDVELLLACLKAHDWSGADGPIAQPRFQWFIGGGYDVRFERAFEAQDYLPLPKALVRQGPDGSAIADRYMRVRDRIRDRIDKLQARINARYANRGGAEYAALFGDDPPRRPRVLFQTSRFTTVLQYATADTAAAFAALGYDTHTLIEPADHLRFTNVTLQRVIDRFEPDLVFNIDHLRSEYGDTIPPQLPYICWVQDHLPNLTDAQAGATVNAREFVLNMLATLYEQQWGYPGSQLVAVPKLTRIPHRPRRWEQDGPDLVYVSNASADPQRILADAAAASAGHAAQQRIVEEAGRRILATYAAGQSLPTMGHVGAIADDALRDMGIARIDAAGRARLVHLLNHPLNDALYRQQALAWAADAADALGLQLAIYGNRWEQHPRFARHAQGPVAYGRPLEELTRSARICLQIVPSYCLHQRLIDGLAAGGFFLVRTNPADTVFPRLAALLTSHAPHAQTAEQALRQVPDGQRGCLQNLIEQAKPLADIGSPVDIVAWTRRAIESGVLDPALPDGALPRLGDVGFNDPEQLRRRMERYIDDRPARDAIAAEQRGFVASRLTYEHGMRRAMRRIAQLIAKETRAAA